MLIAINSKSEREDKRRNLSEVRPEFARATNYLSLRGGGEQSELSDGENYRFGEKLACR